MSNLTYLYGDCYSGLVGPLQLSWFQPPFILYLTAALEPLVMTKKCGRQQTAKRREQTADQHKITTCGPQKPRLLPLGKYLPPASVLPAAPRASSLAYWPPLGEGFPVPNIVGHGKSSNRQKLDHKDRYRSFMQLTVQRRRLLRATGFPCNA